MSTPAKPRRPKRHATVAPSELARTLHTKLDAAKLKLLDVQKAEQPRGGDSESHRDLVMQFVRSARGVYPVAKTFGKDWLPGNRFKVWRDKWEDGLAAAEQTLWHHVQKLRDIDEHGEGAPSYPWPSLSHSLRADRRCDPGIRSRPPANRFQNRRWLQPLPGQAGERGVRGILEAMPPVC